MLPIALDEQIRSTRAGVLEYIVARLSLVRKGSLAILDQGLISGSNFLLGIVLARWLAPAQYGAYATAYSIFLLVSLLYQALLLEPQSVFGPSEYAARPRKYLSSLFWVHAALAMLLILILLVWAWIGREMDWSPALSRAFIGVIIATPFILLFWLVRGACYSGLAPGKALEGSFPYCVLVLCVAAVIYRGGAMSPMLAFLVMGTGSLAASAFVLWRFYSSTTRVENEVRLPKVIKRHWTYGRWALATSVVVWIPGNIYYSILARHGGLTQVADLRALLNFFIPLGHLLNSLSKILLPYAAGKHGLHGRAGAWHRAMKGLSLFVCTVFVYWIIVIPIERPLFRLLYNGRFTSVAWLLPWLALASMLSFGTLSTAISLRAMQKPSAVFVVYGVASALCLVIGVPAAIAFGLRGVIVGLNISSFGGLVTGISLVRATATAQL